MSDPVVFSDEIAQLRSVLAQVHEAARANPSNPRCVEIATLTKAFEKKSPIPQPIVPTWARGKFESVWDTCVSGVNEAFARGYVDEDLSHYVYEAAMTAVYGPDIFKALEKLRP